jgi:hypothetical protein
VKAQALGALRPQPQGLEVPFRTLPAELVCGKLADLDGLLRAGMQTSQAQDAAILELSFAIAHSHIAYRANPRA